MVRRLSHDDNVLRAHGSVLDEIKESKIFGPIIQDIPLWDARLSQKSGVVTIALYRTIKAKFPIIIIRQRLCRVHKHGRQVLLKKWQITILARLVAAQDKITFPRRRQQHPVGSEDATELGQPLLMRLFGEMGKDRIAKNQIEGIVRESRGGKRINQAKIAPSVG